MVERKACGPADAADDSTPTDVCATDEDCGGGVDAVGVCQFELHLCHHPLYEMRTVRAVE